MLAGAVQTNKLYNGRAPCELPTELLVAIFRFAAYTSTQSAVVLTRVSRWTRDIAMQSLYSVVVVRGEDPPLWPLGYTDLSLYTADDDGSGATVHNLGMDSFMELVHTGPAPIMGRGSCNGRQRSASSNPPLAIPTDTLTALWHDNRCNYGSPRHWSLSLLPFLNKQTSIRALACDARSVPVFDYCNSCAFRPTHLKVLDGRDRIFGSAFTAIILHVLGLKKRRDDDGLVAGGALFSSVTHLELGAIEVTHKNNFEENLQLIFTFFPALSHLAFSFLSTRNILEPTLGLVRAMLAYKHTDGRTLQALLLVIRDVGEPRSSTGAVAEDGMEARAGDGRDYLCAAQDVVREVNDPRIMLSVRGGAEWQDWQRLCRRGDDIWSAAREASGCE